MQTAGETVVFSESVQGNACRRCQPSNSMNMYTNSTAALVDLGFVAGPFVHRRTAQVDSRVDYEVNYLLPCSSEFSTNSNCRLRS